MLHTSVGIMTERKYGLAIKPHINLYRSQAPALKKKKHLKSKQPPYNQYNPSSAFMTLSVLYVLDVDHHHSGRKINLNLSLLTLSLVHFTTNCKDRVHHWV